MQSIPCTAKISNLHDSEKMLRHKRNLSQKSEETVVIFNTLWEKEKLKKFWQLEIKLWKGE